jgi:hypothetical protein
LPILGTTPCSSCIRLNKSLLNIIVIVAIAMDDAKGFVGSRHLPDRTSKPFAKKTGFAVPGAHAEGIGICVTHTGHCKKILHKQNLNKFLLMIPVKLVGQTLKYIQELDLLYWMIVLLDGE